MKAIPGSVISFILAAVVASSGALGSERLGSVVALNKDLVCYDFGSKQVAVLMNSSDLEGAEVLAVSESGQKIALAKDGNLFVKFKDSDKPALITELNGQPFDIGNAKNVRFSAEKDWLYFESEAKGKSFVALPKQSKQEKDLLRKGFDIGEQFPQKYTPIIMAQEDVYTAIRVLDIIRFRAVDTSGKIKFLGRADILQKLQPVGHPAFYPQTFPYIAVNEKTGNLRMEYGYSLSGEAITYYNNFLLDMKNSFKKFGKKRNARYGCFSPDDSLFAFVYQIDEGFGPIEIRATSTGKKKTNDDPGIYEIPLSIQNCQGLFWTRGENPSLSILTKKGVYKIDGEKIAQGVKNAKIIKRSPVFGMENLHDSKILPPPVGNDIASGKPELVAEGISTKKLYWVSKNSFVFRDDDSGALCFWNDDGVTEILKRVPEVYFYCRPQVMEVASTPSTIK
jgi:hypothetical protein